MSTTQELVTTQQTPPLVPIDDTGLGGVTKLTPTRLALVQPMTNDPQGAKVGQLLDTGTGLAYDEVEVVPFKFYQTRVFFPPGSSAQKGVEPLCRSNDGIVPTADAKVKQSNKCSNCPRAQWNNEVKPAKPPDCRQSLNMLVVDAATDMPHFLSASGKSFVPVRTKLTGLDSLIRQDQKAGKESAPYHYSLTVGSEKAGANWKLVIKTIKKLPEAARKFYTDMYMSFKQVAEEQQQYEAGEAVVDNAVGTVLEGELVQEV